MTLILSILLALTSLVVKSATTFGYSGYKYFLPMEHMANSIVGEVMGPCGDYGTVRYEDFAWLSNALAERNYAINGCRDFRNIAISNLALRVDECSNYSTNKHYSGLYPTYRSPSGMLQVRQWLENYPICGETLIVTPKNVLNDLVFNRENDFQTPGRKIIETNVISITQLQRHYTNAVHQVRSLDGVNSVTCSVPYDVNISTQRLATVEDYCFNNYETPYKPLSVYDTLTQRYIMGFCNFSDYYLNIPQIIDKSIVTNLYGVIGKAYGWGKVKYLRSDNESDIVIDEYYNTPQSETEQNYTYRTSGAKYSILSSLSHGLFNSFETKTDNLTALIPTTISKNVYKLLNGRIPVTKVKLFALCRARYFFYDSSLSSKSNTVEHVFNAIIPLGDFSNIDESYICEIPGYRDYVCVKVLIPNISQKLQVCSRFWGGYVIPERPEYKKRPQSGSSDAEMLISMQYDLEGFYGSFYYDFETNLR